MCQNVTVSDSRVTHRWILQSVASRHLDDVAGAGRAVVAQEFIAVFAVLGLGVVPQEVPHGKSPVLGQVEFLLDHASFLHADCSVGTRNRHAQVIGLSQHEAPHERRRLKIKHTVVEVQVNGALLDTDFTVSPDVVWFTAGIERHEAYLHRVLLLLLALVVGRQGQGRHGFKCTRSTQGTQHRQVCLQQSLHLYNYTAKLMPIVN